MCLSLEILYNELQNSLLPFQITTGGFWSKTGVENLREQNRSYFSESPPLKRIYSDRDGDKKWKIGLREFFFKTKIQTFLLAPKEFLYSHIAYDMRPYF